MKHWLTSCATTNQDNFEKHLLVNLHEFLIPLVNLRSLTAVIFVVAGARGVISVVGTPLDDFL